MMRKLLVPLVSAGLLMGWAGAAVAQVDNVALTKHNLSNLAPGTNNFRLSPGSGTDEVCVFCHTPHNGDTSSVVLWNRTLPGTGSYQMYSSSSIQNAQASQPEGVSLACLSCHDGTVGFDQLINFPGSGAGSNAGWTWIGGANINGSFAELGTDLRNDHPISIDLSVAADAGFRDPGDIENDGVPLYAGSAGSNQVECASCHNPHESVLPTFYRVDNASSALCTTCHIK